MPVTTETPRLPLWRMMFGLALDPGGALRRHLDDVPLAQAFAIPGMAFALFFLQTGLDRSRSGQLDGAGVGMLVLAGLVFGTLGVALVALAGWSAIRLLGGQAGMAEALRSFALSYSPTLIYTLVGIAFSMAFGWHTAVAFGVTGVLWALAPMSAAAREMLGGRQWPAIAVATLCGMLVLIGWARLEALV